MKKLILLIFCVLTGISGMLVSAYFLSDQFEGKAENFYLWMLSFLIGLLLVILIINLFSVFKRGVKKGNLRKVSKKHLRLKLVGNFIILTALNFIAIHYLTPIRQSHSLVSLLIDIGQSVFVGLFVTLVFFGIYKYLADHGFQKTDT